MPRKPRRRTWGTGSLRERGGRWWIRWRENGRQMAKSYATKELAEKVLAKVTRDLAAGDAGLRRDYSDAPTLAKLAEPWLERRQKTHRSGADYQSRWKLHLAPVFGRLKPHEVNAALIRRFIETKLAENPSPQRWATACATCPRSSRTS